MHPPADNRKSAVYFIRQSAAAASVVFLEVFLSKRSARPGQRFNGVIKNSWKFKERVMFLISGCFCYFCALCFRWPRLPRSSSGLVHLKRPGEFILVGIEESSRENDFAPKLSISTCSMFVTYLTRFPSRKHFFLRLQERKVRAVEAEA